MGSTPIYAIPYIDPGDHPNVYPAADKAQADRVEAVLGGGVAGGLGTWVDCKAEVRFCTDASTAANAGQSVTLARYMRIGKTVWYQGRGVIGTGAVVNFALLLPPSAGVAANGGTQGGGPQSAIGGGDAVAGGWLVLAGGDRIVNLIGASAAYSDSVANEQYRWNITYEIV